MEAIEGWEREALSTCGVKIVSESSWIVADGVTGCVCDCWSSNESVQSNGFQSLFSAEEIETHSSTPSHRFLCSLLPGQISATQGWQHVGVALLSLRFSFSNFHFRLSGGKFALFWTTVPSCFGCCWTDFFFFGGGGYIFHDLLLLFIRMRNQSNRVVRGSS